ncbi:hypothetical protein Tco_0448718 [Tanacetum coccineum]
MSTLVFVDPEISTQDDGAQSSRVLVPLPEDPYEAIRQAYLDGTDTESEPFEDPVETETPESPLTIAPPTSLPESTSSTLVPILRRTACMVVHVPPVMSPGLYASTAEVAAMFESAIHKRFRSSYESSPSSSPPYLPSQKCYQGTPLLVEDDEEDEDEEIEESLDSNSVSEDAEDEDDESRGLDDEGYSVESDRFGLGDEEEVVPEDPKDGMVYIDVPTYPPPTPPVQTPPLPEWTSATPATAETERFLTELGAQVEMDIGELFTRLRAVRDEILSQRYQFRSLEHEQERVALTFGALWRLVLAQEWWLAKERRTRLKLAEIVDSMRRDQEPRGDV